MTQVLALHPELKNDLRATLKDALQVLILADPFTQSPNETEKSILAAESLIMKALTELEARRP